MRDRPFRIITIEKVHDRSVFNSGVEVLDRYFREHVAQDVKRRVTACFIALSRDDRIAGYYTLSSAGIYLGDLPAKITKKLPRYPSIPAVRMGRLAVDRTFQGQGLGGALLADALIRVVRSEIAAYALVVDAKDEKAANFYHHHGFIESVSSPLMLFLPLATVPVFAGK